MLHESAILSVYGLHLSLTHPHKFQDTPACSMVTTRATKPTTGVTRHGQDESEAAAPAISNRRHMVAPVNVIKLMDEIGGTRTAAKLGVSTTLLYKAKKEGAINQVVEVAAAWARCPTWADFNTPPAHAGPGPAFGTAPRSGGEVAFLVTLPQTRRKCSSAWQPHWAPRGGSLADKGGCAMSQHDPRSRLLKSTLRWTMVKATGLYSIGCLLPWCGKRMAGPVVLLPAAALFIEFKRPGQSPRPCKPTGWRRCVSWVTGQLGLTAPTRRVAPSWKPWTPLPYSCARDHLWPNHAAGCPCARAAAKPPSR
jgi:hypothetical protein